MTDRQDQQQEASPMGDVVTGPWGSGSGTERDGQRGELVEEGRETVSAEATRLDRPTTGDVEVRAEPAGMVLTSGRPLTVAQAGGRYRYVADVTKAGAKRVPAQLLDGAVNHIKVAHLREGGHHSGEILPQNRNKYSEVKEERAERRRELVKTVFTKKTRKSSTGGRFRPAQVRETRSPRWMTVGPLAAEGAAVAYPNAVVTAPVHMANAQVGGFVGNLVGHSAELLGSMIATPGGAVTALGAALGFTGWHALCEHRRRQSAFRELMSQDGNGDLSADVPADYLTAAFRAAGIIKASSTNTPGQRVDVEAPVVSDGTSWTAQVALPHGSTVGKVRGKLTELASALDRNLPQVAVVNGASERRFTLRVWTGDALPFTGEPVASPLATAASHTLSSGVPVGLDVDGNPVTLNLGKGRHGLVVASSGNGKTVLLQGIAAATVLDPSTRLTILDGKPDGSYSSLEPVCWGFATTAAEGFEEQGADLLEAVAADMDRKLEAAKNGESLTEHVVIVDEFQEWTGSANGAGQKVGEPRYRMRVALDRIARRGRSAKVRLVLASQQYDGRTLDDGVLTNIGWRAIGYAPSKMSQDALGPLAERYGLDTSTTFVDEVQAGACVLAGGGVHPYRSQRSYLLTDEDLATIVARARTLRDQHEAETAPVVDLVDTPAEEVPLDGLAREEVALLAAAAEVYGEDDADTVTAAELYAEVVEGELGWERSKRTEMTVSEALKKAGVAKTAKQETGSDGRRTTVTRYDRADLVAAGHRVTGQQHAA